MQVLVCDDEPDIRLLYRSAFEREGAQVSTAEDGHPNLIVLDLKMPRCDGTTALPKLHAVCPEARVIVVSAHLNMERFSDVEALGAAECFDKLDFLGRIPGLVRALTA
jgi:DNA-binding NtrC family response regulator